MQITTNIKVHADFTVNDGEVSFSDSIIVPASEYEALTPEELEAKQVERFENWKATVEEMAKSEHEASERDAEINEALEYPDSPPEEIEE